MMPSDPSGRSGSPSASVGSERSTRPSLVVSATRAMRRAGNSAVSDRSSVSFMPRASLSTRGSVRPAPSTSRAVTLPWTMAAATGKGRLYCASSVVFGVRVARRTAL